MIISETTSIANYSTFNSQLGFSHSSFISGLIIILIIICYTWVVGAGGPIKHIADNITAVEQVFIVECGNKLSWCGLSLPSSCLPYSQGFTSVVKK